MIKGPGVHQPWAQLGAARVSLFRLYAAVMGCGGLLEVVRGRRWPAVLARVDLAPHLKTMLLARRLYATALYPLECRQRCGLLLPPVPPELFATPVAAASLAALPGAAAAAPAAASSQAAARQAVEAGLPTRAGLAAGGKRVWERSAGGWEGETGNARSKRVRRALDSDLPREVSWALGLLAVNSWEAVKGFEPHVELDGPVTAALARLLVRRLRARADASLSGGPAQRRGGRGGAHGARHAAQLPAPPTPGVVGAALRGARGGARGVRARGRRARAGRGARGGGAVRVLARPRRPRRRGAARRARAFHARVSLRVGAPPPPPPHRLAPRLRRARRRRCAPAPLDPPPSGAR